MEACKLAGRICVISKGCCTYFKRRQLPRSFGDDEEYISLTN